MKNKYTSYSIEELVPMIEHAALDLMEEPVIQARKTDGTYMTLTEVSHQNSMNAMFNSGIRLLAKALIEQLTKDDETEE